MRMEVKVGLVLGLIVICGTAIYLASRNGTQPAQPLAYDQKPAEPAAKPTTAAPTAGVPARPGTPRGTSHTP